MSIIFGVKKKKKILVFLGGTVPGYDWRNNLIKMLSKNKVNAFNPIVDDWSESDQKREEEVKNSSDYNLYVITPSMIGFFSIAEVVYDSFKKPKQTLFCALDEPGDKKWTKHQKKSIDALKKMLQSNNVKVFENLEEIADFLNKKG